MPHIAGHKAHSKAKTMLKSMDKKKGVPKAAKLKVAAAKRDVAAADKKSKAAVSKLTAARKVAAKKPKRKPRAY